MFEPLASKFDFPQAERKILEFWERNHVFEQSLKLRAGAPRFVFYEGPPTANGLPHPGHCLTRAIKDVFPRYRTMCGYLVERKAGWDTHGLPVEVEVCKELGIHGKDEIEKYGVERFNLKCIQSVFRYTREWEEMTRRLGFWVNLQDAYVTFHKSYVESVWWSLKTLFERGLLYQGHKVVWWWAQGGTALSSGEVGEGYRTVDDPSVFVKFPLVSDDRLRALSGSIGVPPVSPASSVPPVTNAVVPPAALSARRQIVGEQLSKRRRILPHWEAGGSTYFMTFRVQSGELSDAERTLILNACRHFDEQRYLLHAAVVMPDHVHLLWTPLQKGDGTWWSIGDLMHSIRGFTAKQINAARGTSGAVWQREYFDRIIRDESDFDEKWSYVVTNPARRGLPETYAWVWVEPSHAKARHGATSRQDVETMDRRDADAPQPARAGDRRDADAPRVSLLVWTTTPWTLISNHFAAVHPDLEYALVEDPGAEGGEAEYLYIAKELVDSVAKKVKRELKIVGTFRGTDLAGLRYEPPFQEAYYKKQISPALFIRSQGNSPDVNEPGTTMGMARALRRNPNDGVEYIGWRVLEASFVTIESGTGLVHEAPAFGEVDFNLLQEERREFAPSHFDEIPLLNAVSPDGRFNDDAPERYRGRWVKDCDKEIIRELRDERKTPWGTPLLYHQEVYRHEYPFCPRAENDPLIQYARKSWFVRTSQFKEEFLKNNATLNWLPEHIKEGRFGDFLRNNVDWALSRERYWGTPLPIWQCETCGRMEAIGSFAELQSKPGATDATAEYPQGYWNAKVAEHAAEGETLPDHLRVHKPYIDAWTYECGECRDQGSGSGERPGSIGVPPVVPGDSGVPPARMRRVPEVIDCWWDAGSMPFAQWGFPHVPGSDEMLAHRFPADFISEAIDQTRGWFYGLLSISTMLFSEEGKTWQKHSRVHDGSGPRIRSASGSRSSSRSRSGTSGRTRSGPPEYPLPFRTCIVLGHMMGEDGLKMSKRKKNYREPSYVFDHYGADAMRWYFFSAQTPWTSVRFQEAAIRDAQREFLVKLYNVLSFFNIYANIDGFEASFESRAKSSELQTPSTAASELAALNSQLATPRGTAWRPAAQRSELDRWILSELHRTIRAVRESMDRFENYPAAQRLNDFVEALSNWYVRRSRDRFWRAVENAECRRQKAEGGMQNAETRSVVQAKQAGGAAHEGGGPAASQPATNAGGASAFCILHSAFSPADQDKWDAYNTLYECLLTLGKLIAPFTPFFAETMYRSLKGTKAEAHDTGATPDKAPGELRPSVPSSLASCSVHLCDYPVADPALIDEDLAAEMDIVREIVSLGRAARTDAKLKVRQPLRQVEIILARHEHESWLRSHAALIAEELNVKNVEFATQADHYVTYQVKPNFKAIGPKFGKLAPRIAAALARLPDASNARRTLTDSGALVLDVDGQRVTLSPDEVEVRLDPKEGWSAAQGRVGVVVVSTEVPPELREEGLIRELIHHVQAARKEQDFAYEARIAVSLSAEPAFANVVRKFDALLRSECLADSIEYLPAAPADATDLTIEGHAVKLHVRRR